MIYLIQIQCTFGIFQRFLRKIDGNLRSGDAGEPLILTPLIEAGRYEEAQTAAEVHLEDLLSVKSYAGYITVDKRFDSNIFFWFFPSESDYLNDPVILWLQGGPGSSSMFGLFGENGPFIFNAKHEIELREHRWSKTHSVIYIDNPAGTGFSFTNGGYAENQTKVGSDLFECLQQFYAMFPEIQNNKFFITGESYAGKYIPALGHAILRKNPQAPIKINLEGMAIGNGLSDPENQFRYAEYLYQIGMVDLNTRNKMNELEDKCEYSSTFQQLQLRVI
ncbi:hypothetical protein JTB14_029358 [Gonioctena quinquepunctata]|nr:hypothetical protein JTB14_029358 [Gonioctena quinquepunctata]